MGGWISLRIKLTSALIDIEIDWRLSFAKTKYSLIIIDGHGQLFVKVFDMKVVIY